MKNIQKMSLAAAMVIGLVGCGGGSSSGSDGSGNLPPVAQPPVQKPPATQPPVQQPPQQVENHIEFKVLAEADWDLNYGAFITTDGSNMTYKWKRSSADGSSNLAAAVYAAADWNTALKSEAFNSVVNTQDTLSDTNGWDLLVYDQYSDSDLFDQWIQKYGDGNGVFNANEKIRDDWGAYDSYGAVIGLYRAYKLGEDVIITKEKFDASIEAVKSRLANYAVEEKDYAFFKLIEAETGIHVHDYPDHIDAATFDAQFFAFAVRAYGVEGIQMTKSEVEKKLIENAKNADTSLTSIDNLAGFNAIK